MKLSPREGQVLALLSTGRTYRETGEHLGISLDTVRTYVRRMYRVLEAHSIFEAVVNYERLRQKEMNHD